MIRKVLFGLLFLSASVTAQTPPPSLTTLYSFKGGADGANPHARVTIGANGVLYGTTYAGGAYNYGTVFSLTPPASPSGAWTENVIYSFPGTSNGTQPESGVVIDGSGVLYGTANAYTGGIDGIAYSLTPPSSPGGPWTEMVLHNFGGTGYGGGARGGMVLGPEGILYGVTQYGGSANVGTVFALAPPSTASGAWTYNVLHSFKSGGDGSYPVAGLTIGSGTPNHLVLYGTTAAGGATNDGTAFSLTPPASAGGPWTEAVLHSFAGGADGAQPSTALVIGTGGIYGTTAAGGASNAGTVFSLASPASSGGPWTENVIYSFATITSGPGPVPGPLAFRETGLFGITQSGGASTAGTIYLLQPPASAGGAWKEIQLYTFTGGLDGAGPTGLAPGSGGVFYGTTTTGGAYGYGTVFALKL